MLALGRWGLMYICGNRSYFTGGKVTISGYDNAWMSEIIDTFELDATSSTNGSWMMAPFNLSIPRESASSGCRRQPDSALGKNQWKYQENDAVTSDPQTGNFPETYTLKTTHTRSVSPQCQQHCLRRRQ